MSNLFCSSTHGTVRRFGIEKGTELVLFDLSTVEVNKMPVLGHVHCQTFKKQQCLKAVCVICRDVIFFLAFPKDAPNHNMVRVASGHLARGNYFFLTTHAMLVTLHRPGFWIGGAMGKEARTVN